MSEQNIRPPTTCDSSLNSRINYKDDSKIQQKFDGGCLKRENITFNYKIILSFCIVFEINSCPVNLEFNFALAGSFIGTVKLNKNDDPDK